MATFNTTQNPCPFNWYSSDPAFQADADRVVTFVLRRLGEDFLSVELTRKMVYAAFEEATMALNAGIIEYQAKSNLTSLLGTPTASIDPITGIAASGSINFTNVYVYPSLDWLNRQAEPYLASIGYGQSQDTYTGSIILTGGRQDYDLYTELKDQNGVPLYDYSFSGSSTPMRVLEVYHLGPANYIFNSNYMTANGLAVSPQEGFISGGAGFAGDVSGGGLSTYYMLPIFEDVLRGTMLQAANNVRMSTYRYRVTGRMLRIYPPPRDSRRLWIRVIFPVNVAPGVLPPSGSYSGISGGYYINGDGFPTQIAPGGGNIYVAGNPATIAAGLVDYSSLNPWARSWIFQYTLAICKEMVGLVRTKFKDFPIPGAELQLNGFEILDQAAKEKDYLLFGDGGLYTKLDNLTFDKLAEKDAAKAESLNKLLSYLPLPPGGLSWG